MWQSFFYKGYYVEIKHYEESSEFGINGGRISKLYISSNKKAVCNYDRGWDIRPETDDAQAVYEEILKKYN